MFFKHGGFEHNPDSVNQFYNWLCNRMVDYEQNLYQVTYDKFGIKTTYISAFRSQHDPTKKLYILHAWFTKYQFPDKKDIEISNLLENEDGWGNLLTVMVQDISNLNKQQKNFVRRKFDQKPQDLQLITESLPLENKNWRILNKKDLLKHSKDWRQALPILDLTKKDLFINLPPSHFEYNTNFFPPSGYFDLLPPGDFYGV